MMSRLLLLPLFLLLIVQNPHYTQSAVLRDCSSPLSRDQKMFITVNFEDINNNCRWSVSFKNNSNEASETEIHTEQTNTIINYLITLENGTQIQRKYLSKKGNILVPSTKFILQIILVQKKSQKDNFKSFSIVLKKVRGRMFTSRLTSTSVRPVNKVTTNVLTATISYNKMTSITANKTQKKKTNDCEESLWKIKHPNGMTTLNIGEEITISTTRKLRKGDSCSKTFHFSQKIKSIRVKDERLFCVDVKPGVDKLTIAIKNSMIIIMGRHFVEKTSYKIEGSGDKCTQTARTNTAAAFFTSITTFTPHMRTTTTSLMALASCATDELLSFPGQILSPNYPDYFNGWNREECSYKIKTSSNKRIEVTIHSVNISSYKIFIHENREEHPITFNTTLKVFRSKSSTIIIKFKQIRSKNSPSRFKISYEDIEVGCKIPNSPSLEIRKKGNPEEHLSNKLEAPGTVITYYCKNQMNRLVYDVSTIVKPKEVGESSCEEEEWKPKIPSCMSVCGGTYRVNTSHAGGPFYVPKMMKKQINSREWACEWTIIPKEGVTIQIERVHIKQSQTIILKSDGIAEQTLTSSDCKKKNGNCKRKFNYNKKVVVILEQTVDTKGQTNYPIKIEAKESPFCNMSSITNIKQGLNYKPKIAKINEDVRFSCKSGMEVDLRTGTCSLEMFSGKAVLLPKGIRECALSCNEKQAEMTIERQLKSVRISSNYQSTCTWKMKSDDNTVNTAPKVTIKGNGKNYRSPECQMVKQKYKLWICKAKMQNLPKNVTLTLYYKLETPKQNQMIPTLIPTSISKSTNSLLHRLIYPLLTSACVMMLLIGVCSGMRYHRLHHPHTSPFRIPTLKSVTRFLTCANPVAANQNTAAEIWADKERRRQKQEKKMKKMQSLHSSSSKSIDLSIPNPKTDTPVLVHMQRERERTLSRLSRDVDMEELENSLNITRSLHLQPNKQLAYFDCATPNSYSSRAPSAQEINNCDSEVLQ